MGHQRMRHHGVIGQAEGLLHLRQPVEEPPHALAAPEGGEQLRRVAHPLRLDAERVEFRIRQVADVLAGFLDAAPALGEYAGSEGLDRRLAPCGGLGITFRPPGAGLHQRHRLPGDAAQRGALQRRA
jgi:hypothetical protein